jgi:Acyl-CoA carboxylase epsilon subunit
VNEDHEVHEPHIEVLKGNPSDEELAAVIAVLGSAGGGEAEPGPVEHSRWGLPVDKLRFAISNHQRVTLQERVHMRR